MKSVRILVSVAVLVGACQSEPAGLSEPASESDSGARPPKDSSPSTDAFPQGEAVCGNGRVDPGEACDDGVVWVDSEPCALCDCYCESVCPGRRWVADIQTEPARLFVDGDVVYAGSEGYLDFYSASSLPDPPEVQSLSGFGGFFLAISDGTSFACTSNDDGEELIVSHDLTHPGGPVHLGSLPIDGCGWLWGRAGQVAGSALFVGTDDGGLKIVDVSAPSSMVELSRETFDALATRPQVQVADDRAFLVSSSQVVIVDVSSPSSPQLLGSFSNPVGGRFFATGDTLYLGSFEGAGLVKIDVEDPSQPSTVWSTEAAGGPYDVRDDILIARGDDKSLSILRDEGASVVPIAEYTSPVFRLGSFQGYGNYGDAALVGDSLVMTWEEDLTGALEVANIGCL